jgi:FtsP/CotA-like multicopper oxidase with cupredoxin domain
MNRRSFLHLSIASALMGVSPAAPAWFARAPMATRELLPPYVTKSAFGSLSLTAAAGNYDLGAGPQSGGLLFNQSWPSPTLRVNQGEVFDLTLNNQLSEPTIVHWHGLTPPADMDGHPNSAIAAGSNRPYLFTINNRAGTYWYHPHPHERTAYQVYYGLAGFLLVSDGQDAARGLPTGARDLPLLLADKRLTGGTLQYAPSMGEMMSGFLGNAVLVNGRLAPVLAVEPAIVRLRLLNGSNARILNPAFADGRSFWLVGTDAGLLSAPVAVTSVLLAPGERVEVLLDLRGSSGQNVDFVSAAFTINAPSPASAPAQGSGFDLMRFQVTLPLSGPPGEIPTAFEPVPPPPILSGPVRLFQLTQSGPQHFINGLVYDIGRVDFSAAQGRPEIWRFVNAGNQPHPMHVHAAHFRVLSRTGSALPTDAGLKDTVLVRVGESVDVSLRFDVPGLFLVHCHNLEHEDNGMMLNFTVDPPLFRDGFEAVV